MLLLINALLLLNLILPLSFLPLTGSIFGLLTPSILRLSLLLNALLLLHLDLLLTLLLDLLLLSLPLIAASLILLAHLLAPILVLSLGLLLILLWLIVLITTLSARVAANAQKERQPQRGRDRKTLVILMSHNFPFIREVPAHHK
ncbi:MAG TPA: hypothetical protein VGJ02_04045 [Pyrinomonadaceae bacterium]